MRVRDGESRQHMFHIATSDLMHLLTTYGYWAVLVFVAVLRAWAAFLAGTNRMRWQRFLLFNAAGGIVWATLYGLGGYLLGEDVHRLTGPIGTVALVLAVLVIIAFLVFLRRNEHRLEEEAERALPGPLYTYEPRPRDPPDERRSRRKEVRRNTDVD